MGHSFGGFLSLAQAIQRPEDVSALVLVAAGPGFRKAEAREQWNESVRAAAAKMDQSPGVEEISMHHDSFVLDHLSEIRCPVLVLLGERDKRFAASASLFARDLDVWASVVVPGQGHMVHLKAAEACAGEVRRFLADVFPVT
jgi:pimeloyl-ACP methyl ester carboxylesterase